jgi:hypothetical protein
MLLLRNANASNPARDRRSHFLIKARHHLEDRRLEDRHLENRRLEDHRLEDQKEKGQKEKGQEEGNDILTCKDSDSDMDLWVRHLQQVRTPAP